MNALSGCSYFEEKPNTIFIDGFCAEYTPIRLTDAEKSHTPIEVRRRVGKNDFKYDCRCDVPSAREICQKVTDALKVSDKATRIPDKP